MRTRHPTDTFRDLYICARWNGIGVIMGHTLDINDAREYRGIGIEQASSAIGTEKIGKLLAAHGGKMADVVKLVTYVTSIKDRDAMNQCRAEAFKGGPLPVHTFLVISELARLGMIVEIDVIAVVPAGK